MTGNILCSAITQLREAVPSAEIVVFSRNAEHTRKYQNVNRAVNARLSLRSQLQPEVKRLDILLVGGGGISYDRESAYYLRVATIAHQAGVAAQYPGGKPSVIAASDR